MKPSIFLNLPVENLQQSMAFYTAIGFVNNPQFTDASAASMIYAESVFIMLLQTERFKSFTHKTLANTKQTVGALYALQLSSVAEMEQVYAAAIANGATVHGEAKDYGFMQQKAFEDADGHVWEVFYMDIEKFPKQ
jgi:uncharacterized protein